MNNSIKLLVSELDNGFKLDILLKKYVTNFSRSNLKKIIENKQVKINNIIAESPTKKIKSNDVIEINFVKKKPLNLTQFLYACCMIQCVKLYRILGALFLMACSLVRKRSRVRLTLRAQ